MEVEVKRVILFLLLVSSCLFADNVKVRIHIVSSAYTDMQSDMKFAERIANLFRRKGREVEIVHQNVSVPMNELTMLRTREPLFNYLKDGSAEIVEIVIHREPREVVDAAVNLRHREYLAALEARRKPITQTEFHFRIEPKVFGSVRKGGVVQDQGSGERLGFVVYIFPRLYYVLNDTNIITGDLRLRVVRDGEIVRSQNASLGAYGDNPKNIETWARIVTDLPPGDYEIQLVIRDSLIVGRDHFTKTE